jgi:hypothetical protein
MPTADLFFCPFCLTPIPITDGEDVSTRKIYSHRQSSPGRPSVSWECPNSGVPISEARSVGELVS